MSLVSVVIPARNAATTIGKTLLSLTKDADVIGEILVIDDGSSDHTADHAIHVGRQLGLPVTVHRVSCSSAGGARNHGIQNVKFPLLYFIDADDSLLPHKLKLMVTQLAKKTDAKLVIGASVRVTPGQKRLLRIPARYTDQPLQNAEMYLRNGAPPIAMGSALVHIDALKTIRFPEKISIDEDTWFWSALLAQAKVIPLEDIIVRYNLDAQRTANRFCASPRKTWLSIVREFDDFRKLGISKDVLDYRKAWLAQRFTRQLIKNGRHHEARMMLRPAIAHPSLAREMRTMRYRIKSKIGQIFGRLTLNNRTANDAHTDARTMIVSHDPACPPVSGADLRTYQNARLALRRGPVLMASFREHDVDGGHEGIELVSLTKTGDPRSSSVNSNRLTGEPRISRVALDRLLATVDDFKPETIIVEGVFLRSLLGHLRTRQCQLIVDMHNVESNLARQLHSEKPSWAQRFNDWKICRVEKAVIKQVDRIWVCTEEDRGRIVDAYGIATPIHVIPNGIPQRAASYPQKLGQMREMGEAPNLIFVGHLGYMPNVEAAERLAMHIFPEIRKVFAGASLHLVGRYPKQQVRALASLPGIELHENPDDVGPYLQRADVSIIPLNKGGGSRIKILEAVFCGVPVIASKNAVEGLVLTAEADLIIANSNEEMVGEAIKLLKDPKNRTEIRASAFSSVQRLYADASIARFFDEGLGL